MKMNLRKNSAEPLNYESIFSGQGQFSDFNEVRISKIELR